jgi:predicted glycoside hydrolase/deacetylase ChbG (UPF0249 family)
MSFSETPGTIRVIVNADDLGYSSEVNKAIFELMDLGRVTSATLMANGPAFEEAVMGLGARPGCSFGVHLNVTEFRPLTSPEGLARILNGAGEFAGNSIRKVPLDSALCDAIYQEWAAQIRKIRSSGVNISHLDSHHHTHSIPRLFLVLKRLQRDFQIHRIRLTKNLYGAQWPVSSKLRLLKKAWNLALRHHVRTRTTSTFTSFIEFHELASASRSLGTILEAMVHPGNPGFAEETRLLRTPWEESLPRRIQLINYWGL